MFNNEIDFQLYPQLCTQSKTISRELQCRDSNQANIPSMPFIAISNSKRENEMKGLVRRCNEEVVVYRGGACGYFVCGGSTLYHPAPCSLSITLSAPELLLWLHRLLLLLYTGSSYHSLGTPFFISSCSTL